MSERTPFNQDKLSTIAQSGPYPCYYCYYYAGGQLVKTVVIVSFELTFNVFVTVQFKLNFNSVTITSANVF